MKKEHVTKKFRQKMRNIMLKKWENPEYRKHMSDAHKGKKFSNETKLKMSLAQKGKHHHPHTEETKQKIAQKSRDLWKDPTYRAKNKTSSGMKVSSELREKLRALGKKENHLRDFTLRQSKSWFSKNGRLGGIATVKKGRYISHPQRRLFEFIKIKYPEARLEYPIELPDGRIRFADIAIVEEMIDIEYDGWIHSKKQKEDKKRDKELLELGWKTIRVNKENQKSFLLEFGLIDEIV